MEVAPEPEAPKGLGARIKEAAAKLASPLLGGEGSPATPPAGGPAPPAAPPAKAAAEEGNKVVSGIMESVLQSRRDRVKDAVAAGAGVWVSDCRGLCGAVHVNECCVAGDWLMENLDNPTHASMAAMNRA